MNKFFIFLIIGVVVVAGGFYWYQTTQASVGSLNIYNGSAEIVRGSEVSEGRTGTAIKLNDSLKVKVDSRVSIVLKDGSVIRLEAGSEVEVAELEYEGNKLKNAVFKLKLGRLWSHTEPVESGASYQVETPTIVAAIRGTSFNTDYLNSLNSVYVSQHSVGVTLAAQTNDSKAVSEGQIFVISDANAGSDFNKGPRPVTPDDQDDWVKFNISEDAKLGVAQPTITLNPSPTPSSSSSPSLTPKPSSSGQPTVTSQPTGKKTSSLLLTSTRTSVKISEIALLKVEATYTDGSKGDVGAKVIWSQNPSIGNITSPGFFSGVFEGTTKVRASFDGVVSNEITITVTKNSQLSRLEVSFTKDQPSFNAQFKALAKYSDGTSVDVTTSANWTVSGTAKGSINSSGYYVAEGQGSDRVTATYGGINASVTVNIPY